jgi:hypothetical protein
LEKACLGRLPHIEHFCSPNYTGFLSTLFMNTAFRSTTSIHSWLRRSVFPFALFLIVCLAISPNSHAVTPPPDGGYAGGNTAEGQDALFSLTTGLYNTAAGYVALKTNTAGQFNTAVGAGALLFNTASQNTATGAGALLNNTTGSNNTAVGEAALFFNTTGAFNTAVGASVLLTNTTGNANTALGTDALSSNTTASNNTAIGEDALNSNTTGSGNTVVGRNSGFAVTTANNVICIGASVAGANVNDSCYIGSIFGATASGGTAVFIDSNNKLGTVVSSKRFKEEIEPMNNTSEALFSLKPVIFRYKRDIDPDRKGQFGLVAEDVEKINPDLVVRDKEGRPYSVRYEQVNAMLLNEFLKAHRKMEEQGAIIARQQKQIEALSSGLDKVNARLATASLPLRTAGGLEASKPGTRTASE